jgi:hypothetical protein
VAAGLAVIVLGRRASTMLNRAAKPRALKIPAGMSAFALFYVVTTQGLERLLEPFARPWEGTWEAASVRDIEAVEASGTKPLHDLSQNLRESKNGKEAPARVWS